MQHILSLAEKLSVKIVQEVHWSLQQVLALLHKFAQLFHMFDSPAARVKVTLPQGVDFDANTS